MHSISVSSHDDAATVVSVHCSYTPYSQFCPPNPSLVTYRASRQLFNRKVQDISATRSRTLRTRNMRKDKEQDREEVVHC
jgi:hypothetical protein